MRIANLSLIPLALLVGSPVLAQPAPTIAVQMSNFKFAPDTVVLDHGRSYVLHLTNVSGGGHDFTAPAFFAAANVAPADRRYIVDGLVEVPSGKAIDIHLTAPAAGRYKLKCTHSLHKMFGMSGAIVVR